MRITLLFLIFGLLTVASTLPAQVITKPTQMGINLTDPSPNVSLHIKDDFEAIRLDGDAPFISFYDGTNYRGYLYMTSNDMYLFNREPGDLRFGTNNSTRMIINESGDLGIGTTSPENPLHVADGTVLGGTFNSNTIAGFEKGFGNAFLSVLTNSANESGLLFGDETFGARGAMVYNNGSTPDGLQFRVNGNLTKMTIDSQGDVGIGRTNPLRPIHLKSRNGGDEYGIMMERSGSSVRWEMSVFRGNFNWFYDNGTVPVATISTTGTYSSSDRRLKKNIKAYKTVLPLINQLNISTYNMINNSKRSETSLGLIAQDVAEVFPEIVRLSPDREGEMYYSMDYSKTGVIALKAIQELQQNLQEKEAINEELQGTVKELRSENAKLQDRLAAVEGAIAQLQENCCTRTPSIILDQPEDFKKEQPLLKQNEPNPFSNNTKIRYFIPQQVQDAALRVVTMDGKLVREIPIITKGDGAVILETQSLDPGTYVYTLLIDGEIYESKKMVLK